MIISYLAAFDMVNIIIFQITERIAIVKKSIKSVLGHCENMLGFSYLAIPARHEAQRSPYLHGILKNDCINPQNSKIADMAKNKY